MYRIKDYSNEKRTEFIVKFRFDREVAPEKIEPVLDRIYTHPTHVMDSCDITGYLHGYGWRYHGNYRFGSHWVFKKGWFGPVSDSYRYPVFLFESSFLEKNKEALIISPNRFRTGFKIKAIVSGEKRELSDILNVESLNRFILDGR